MLNVSGLSPLKVASDMAPEVLVLTGLLSTLRVGLGVWMAERTMRGRDEKMKRKTSWKVSLI